MAVPKLNTWKPESTTANVAQKFQILDIQLGMLNV
jgi:hypothetical protein